MGWHLTPDTSYPTGGYTIPALSFGLQRVVRTNAEVFIPGSCAAASAFAFPQADGSVRLRINTATGQISNGTNCSDAYVIVTAYGDG